MNATFTPNFGLSLADAATACGYDHFNWRQTVTDCPHCDEPGLVTATGISGSFTDPPNGYLSIPSMVDALPFYWREEGDPFNPVSCIPPNGGGVFRSCNQGPFFDFFDPSFLTFFDQPRLPFLAAGESVDFVTELVGIKKSGGSIDVLNKFTWSSDYAGSSGSVFTASTPDDIDIGGTGGIFDLRTNVPVGIPEPNTIYLLGTGLVALLGYGRLRKAQVA
jgi:hypothetical protein